MQLLPYLNTKMLKTVTVNVPRSNYDRNVSAEILNVVEDSGEGRFFYCRLVRGSNEKSGPGATGTRVGCGGFFT